MENLISILLFGLLFFFMMRFGCGAHMSHRGGHGRQAPRDEGSILSRDPVCGMEVSPDSGYRKTMNGQEYRFCSRQCLDQFESNSDRYAA